MSTRVNRQGKVSHWAAPPTAREPNAMAARSAANQPRPIAAPLATSLTVSLATLTTQGRRGRHAGGAANRGDLHERARRTSRSADVACDPSKDIGVNVRRFAYARPVAGEQ